jgi:protein-S-isoprenylcysteine O-methyltransferase Ste14
VFTLWARLALGTMWSASPIVKETHELRTHGPYGVTRHPIYTGLVGMLLGTSLLAGLGRWAPLFPVGVVVAEIKIHMEERLMAATFPDDYPRYRRLVPQLIPGLRLILRGRSRPAHAPGRERRGQSCRGSCRAARRSRGRSSGRPP